ncbi:hypothetical protein CTI12_AA591910 [Artemisia annua]|uniref:Helitron helicase-like domain-containing protein n=1 Tax=Artemisia annua TaxID=35608 RepID=A0A2U1KKZ8_ARTAN|nr:hypothetical protein CTI12_AA591910 [Artemisia annua]
MDTGLHDEHSEIPSLSDILNKTLFIQSTTIINESGNIQSFCGLRMSQIVGPSTGTLSQRAAKKPHLELHMHLQIPYHNNKGVRKTKRPFVTMKEYYSYIIQQRNNQGTTLVRGGRLFQQFLVDAYAAVEEQRLSWTRQNQDTLRMDLYHNLCDVVTREWTHAISESSVWMFGPQLRDIFVTILLFCDVSKPLKLWEENWQFLSEDILYKKKKMFDYPDLELTDEQLRNYCLVESC